MSRKGPTPARPRKPKPRPASVAPVYDSHPPAVTRNEVLFALALALLTAAAYGRVFSNGFVNLDDDYYVYRNGSTTIGLRWPAVRWAFTTIFLGNWHPLTWLSLQLDNQLFGLNPAGYHATNLVLHMAGTLALYWMLRNVTGAALPSACSAALFALHPLHVESVAWVTERKDVLSTLFFFLSIVAWQRYATCSSRRAYLLAIALFACSLLSKVMGVSLPIVLLLLDFWPLRRVAAVDVAAAKTNAGRPILAALVVEKLPFVAMSAVFSVVAVIAQRSTGALVYGESLSLIERWQLVPVNYVTYLAKTFWPVNLAVLYPHPGGDLPLWKPVGATLLLVAITAVCCWLRNSRPYLIVGWAWFLVTLLPVIGMVQLGVQATADRYMYMPMAGLLIMVCWGGAELAGTVASRKPVLATICVFALAACGRLTFRQVAVWHDSLSLWKHDLEITAPTFFSSNNYAQALQDAGNVNEAEHWYRKSIELNPTWFYPNFNLGIILSKKGHQDEAAKCLKIALESQPENPLLLENLGVVEELRGNYEEAIEYYERSARIAPRSKIHQHLRRVLEKRGKVAGAEPR